MIVVQTPITDEIVQTLTVGDSLSISGFIFTGRDAVLPKLVTLFQENRLPEIGIDLQGGVIFHSAVSPAGVGPTSSNKIEIESSIPELSRAGIKLHLGKGALTNATVQSLHEHHAVFATIPPVTALLTSRIKKKTVAAFPEEGMEALHLLYVEGFPAVVSAAHGQSLFRS